MANYPSFPILDTSRAPRVDGYLPLRASNGALKVRKLVTGEKRDFTVDHFITQADRDTLESFYQTNKLLDVTFRWPGQASTFNVRFIAAPLDIGVQGAWYHVQVKLSQV